MPDPCCFDQSLDRLLTRSPRLEHTSLSLPCTVSRALINLPEQQRPTAKNNINLLPHLPTVPLRASANVLIACSPNRPVQSTLYLPCTMRPDSIDIHQRPQNNINASPHLKYRENLPRTCNVICWIFFQITIITAKGRHQRNLLRFLGKFVRVLW